MRLCAGAYPAGRLQQRRFLQHACREHRFRRFQRTGCQQRSRPREEDAAAGTADTAKLEAIVTAIEAVNAISNPMVIDDFYLENFMNLTLDNIVAFQGDVTNDQADCALVLAIQARAARPMR